MAAGSEGVPVDASIWPRSEPFPSDADLLVPPQDRDLTLAWRVLGAAVVVTSCALVLWVLHPNLLLRNTTPNGGDLGAHVWFPAFLRDHLLPNWRVAGWSNDWFGGFPAGQFYFPVPALVTVLLGVVLPYNVALKLTTALGPVFMPAAAYAFGRGIRMRRPGPELSAVATVCFLFFKGIATGANASATDDRDPVQPAHHGRNARELARGGVLVRVRADARARSRSVRSRSPCAPAGARRSPRCSSGATVMSHVVVGIFAVVGALVILVVASTDRRSRVSRVLGRGVAIGGVAALLTAFWTLPLVATFGYTANMRYQKLTSYVAYLWVDEFLWVYLLALVGLVLGVVFRDRATLTVAAIAGIFALVFRFWPELHAWNLRFLPFWYLGVFLLAAIGAAEIVRRLSGEFGRIYAGPPASEDAAYADDGRTGRTYRVVTSSTIVVVVVLLTVVGTWFNDAHQGFLTYWAEWNETGYEHAAARGDANYKAEARKQYPEYRALIDRMAELPAGRALWEGGSSIDAYGTPLALMLLPYWTHGRIQSFEGLYYESAASTPYVFMAIAPLSASGNASNPVRGIDYLSITNFADGVKYLRALGGRYYLAHSQAAKDRGRPRCAGCVSSARRPTWTGSRPRGGTSTRCVTTRSSRPWGTSPSSSRRTKERSTRASAVRPAPIPGRSSARWECVAAGWWAKPAQLDRPLAASGPASWRRATAKTAAATPRRRLPAVAVTDIHQTDDDIRFHVSRTGVPVVVRTSYFPNWEAHGAQRSVATLAEPHGGGADEPRRRAALRSLGGREGRCGGLTRRAGRARRPRHLGRAATSPAPQPGRNRPDHGRLSVATTRASRRAGATMIVPPRGR